MFDMWMEITENLGNMETFKFEILIGRMKIHRWINCLYMIIIWCIKFIPLGGLQNTIEEGQVVTRDWC